jgi:hypothetical protein
MYVLLWNHCSRGWRNLSITHQLQGQGQRLKRCERHKWRPAIEPRTIGWIAHPWRQGSEETWPVLYQNRASSLPPATIAGAQHPAKKRMPWIFDPQLPFFVCGMIADLQTG